MELKGRHVVLRSVTAADAPALAAILAAPGVAAWWGTFDLARVEAELTGNDPDLVVLAVLVGDEVVGSIQFHEEKDPEFRHASMDIFVAPEHQGRGLGPEAIHTLARHLIDARGHHRLTIDPAAANERAIRAYARVGFRPVGTMRQYQRFADGTWHDGLLMELLADELRHDSQIQESEPSPNRT
jgi:aminoglycoside 6'-N-acetyltransferase